MHHTRQLRKQPAKPPRPRLCFRHETNGSQPTCAYQLERRPAKPPIDVWHVRRETKGSQTKRVLFFRLKSDCILNFRITKDSIGPRSPAIWQLRSKLRKILAAPGAQPFGKLRVGLENQHLLTLIISIYGIRPGAPSVRSLL